MSAALLRAARWLRTYVEVNRHMDPYSGFLLRVASLSFYPAPRVLDSTVSSLCPRFFAVLPMSNRCARRTPGAAICAGLKQMTSALGSTSTDGVTIRAQPPYSRRFGRATHLLSLHKH